ncbi:MAG: hypothetical protein K2O03_03405, partial [Lachnospiraceae bacterium]|nr:hypothetical protein [Lachnospiraceae bacterium]
MAKTTIKELKTLYEASEKERYNLDDMWSEDLTEALASGDIQKLEAARKNGWNVNMPLKEIYVSTLERALEDAVKSYNGTVFKPLPGLEEHYSEAAAREGKKDYLMSHIHAEIVFPITWAIKHNCIVSVRWLIKHGATLDVKKYPAREYINNENQHTALAAIGISKEMLNLVVESGAKVKDKSFDYWLFNSLDKNQTEDCLPILMEHGADIEAAIMTVQSAAYHGDINRIEYFLNAGFDINCHTGKGQNFLKDTVLGQ